LDEIAYLDGIDDADTTIKGITNPGGMVTTGTGTAAVFLRYNGIHVSIRSVANLKLCVYYLKHMERVQRKPVANSINLTFVCIYRDRQWHEVSFKKKVEESVINYNNWPRTLETIKEYLASQYGGTRATLDYVVWSYIVFKPEAEDPAEGYDTVDHEMTARAPHTVGAFLDDRRKVWDIMSNIYRNHSYFVYSKPSLRTRNEIEAYISCLTISLGPTMWEIFPVQRRPSSPRPSTMVKRIDSPGRHMYESILNNIQSLIYWRTMANLALIICPRSIIYSR
jgi:hypothetical protein